MTQQKFVFKIELVTNCEEKISMQTVAEILRNLIDRSNMSLSLNRIGWEENGSRSLEIGSKRIRQIKKEI